MMSGTATAVACDLLSDERDLERAESGELMRKPTMPTATQPSTHTSPPFTTQHHPQARRAVDLLLGTRAWTK
jgi:hypothetical protein